jgi:2-amino-4-hydroxy-6-hydroxymethyldihydropteridine diphosphokinase
MGDRPAQLKKAVSLLAGHGLDVVAQSPVYETPPWGNTNQPAFLNKVVQVAWQTQAGTPQALLSICLDVETRMGRIRTEKWGPRTIDIDILAYNDAVINAPGLTIPHPQLAARAFVLVPWAQIAPHFYVAGLDKTVQALCNALPLIEQTSVKIIGA